MKQNGILLAGKKLLISILLISGSLYANTFDEGLIAFSNGEKAKAVELWTQSCDNGNMEGCSSLGVLYSEGRSIKKDMKKAIELYKKACLGENMEGCYSLGVLYGEGKEIKQDKQKAIELYKKACKGGHISSCYKL